MSIKAQYLGMTTGIVSLASFFGAIPQAHAFDLKISGQVNRAIIGVDNGEDQDVGFVDNHASNTRFGFSGSQDINPDYSIGFEYVLGIGDNQSSDFDVNQSPGGVGLQNRQANVFIKGNYGKLTLGKQDGAANSTSKVDFSGLTDLGGGTVVKDYFGDVSFLADDGTVGTAIGNVYDSFDALSRQNAIRYDTPSFGGLTFSASFDEDQAYEFAPRYKSEFGNGIKFEAAADYVDSGQQNKTVLQDGSTTDGGDFQEYGGSASVLLPSGLNFTGQYKRRDYDDMVYANGNEMDNAQTYFGGVGYIFGKNHVQALYGHTDDLYNDGSQADNYGLAYRYDLMDAVNMYASYHYVTADHLDLEGGDAQDINVIFAGVRVKFF